MDETFLHNLALQIGDIRIRLSIMRGFMERCGVSLDELDSAINNALDSPELQKACQSVLEHLKRTNPQVH